MSSYYRFPGGIALYCLAPLHHSAWIIWFWLQPIPLQSAMLYLCFLFFSVALYICFYFISLFSSCTLCFLWFHLPVFELPHVFSFLVSEFSVISIFLNYSQTISCIYILVKPSPARLCHFTSLHHHFPCPRIHFPHHPHCSHPSNNAGFPMLKHHYVIHTFLSSLCTMGMLCTLLCCVWAILICC